MVEHDRAKEDAKAYLTRKIALYKRVFSTDDGQAILTELEDSFLFDQMEDNDPNHAMRREGRRDVVMHIRSFVKSSFNPADEEEQTRGRGTRRSIGP